MRNRIVELGLPEYDVHVNLDMDTGTVTPWPKNGIVWFVDEEEDIVCHRCMLANLEWFDVARLSAEDCKYDPDEIFCSHCGQDISCYVG